MTPHLLNVAAVQLAGADTPRQGLAAVLAAIEQAAAHPIDCIVLSELHNTRYFCQEKNPLHFALAETIPGPTTTALAAAARRHQTVIVGSVFEKTTDGAYYNTAVVFDRDGSLAGYYRKTHIPDGPNYWERFYFRASQAPYTPITTSVGKIGVLICFDQWFPEAARAMRLAGADFLVYPTAIGWELTDPIAEQKRQCDAWQTIQRAHAIANVIPVIVANRYGHEVDPTGTTQGINFWGNSFIAGPQGEFLAAAPADRAITLTATFDLTRNQAVAAVWPFIADRRSELYP